MKVAELFWNTTNSTQGPLRRWWIGISHGFVSLLDALISIGTLGIVQPKLQLAFAFWRAKRWSKKRRENATED